MEKNKTHEIVEYLKSKGYTVSTDGRILTSSTGKIRKTTPRKDGYLCFNTRFDGKSYSIRVHRYVGYLKFGDEAFKEGIEVRHKNGDKKDNSWDNILIGTSSQNKFDIPKNIRIAVASNASKKLDHELILKKRMEGFTYKELMGMFDISSKGTISFIIKKSLEAAKSTPHPQV